MNRLLIATTVGLLSGPALAQPPPPPQLAIHNGSLMQVTSLPGHRVVISYAQPRPSLWGLVAPGTVLLEGQWRNGVLDATAYVFTFSCGPVPYPVTGSVSADGVLTAIGAAPIIDPYSCAIVGQTWSSNATLVFVPEPETRGR